MPRRPTSVVGLANEHVPILTACRLVGMDIPQDAYLGRARKLGCPFGPIYHSDSGAAPAFRVYEDSNSAWCFSCGFYYTPVKLAARAWDMTYQAAAAVLLDRVGYTPPTPARAWADAVGFYEPPDPVMLAEALKTFCRRVHPQWNVLQFRADVAARLGRCLDLLDVVHTDIDAQQWLDGCKTAMRRVLRPAGNMGDR